MADGAPEGEANRAEKFDDEILERLASIWRRRRTSPVQARGGSVLTHVFAVHDVRTVPHPPEVAPRLPAALRPGRTLLYLDDLRDYFGEKVAFYFAFWIIIHGGSRTPRRPRSSSSSSKSSLPEPVRSGLHGGGAAGDGRR